MIFHTNSTNLNMKCLFKTFLASNAILSSICSLLLYSLCSAQCEKWGLICSTDCFGRLFKSFFNISSPCVQLDICLKVLQILQFLQSKYRSGISTVSKYLKSKIIKFQNYRFFVKKCLLIPYKNIKNLYFLWKCIYQILVSFYRYFQVFQDLRVTSIVYEFR